MSGKVDPVAYTRLLDVASKAARREEQALRELEPLIKTAAETDPEDFDATVDYVESMMQRVGSSPLMLETLRLVVHDARELGVPLVDEYGSPHGISSLRLQIQRRREGAEQSKKPVAKKRRRKTK